jgi:hypothetical protein
MGETRKEQAVKRSPSGRCSVVHTRFPQSTDQGEAKWQIVGD